MLEKILKILLNACFDTSNNDVSIMMQQKGILRTNCLDSLDRTNFAQYVFGVVALGYQLDVLRITESRELDFKNSLANDLMSTYQAMVMPFLDNMVDHLHTKRYGPNNSFL